MAKLRVSKRLVGEITLPVIETRTFSAGHIFSLTDEQMKNYAVQKAMKMGLLEEIKKEIPVEEVMTGAIIEDTVSEEDKDEDGEDNEDDEDKIAGPVVEEKAVKEPEMAEKTEEIVKKEEVPIEEKVEVVIVEPAENTEEVKDFSTLNLDDIISRKDPEIETKTNMIAWDFEQQKSLEKNESAKTVMRQMNGIDLTVKTTKEDKDIDLDKKIEEISSKIKVGTMKNAKTKSKSLKPVGHKKEVLGDIMGDMSMPNEEQMFVDQEQTMEAILNHPVLKEKFAKNENNNLQKD